MSEPIPSALRTLVQRRAGHRCEYCLLHEEDADLPHEPDHVIARKHRGETREENLAWTCFACNRHKGSDLASIDVQTGQIVRLFNPRLDQWTSVWRVRVSFL
jgi:5-methylcytosine-specific restriction endonuclease McrA